ncbi:hypothetical protein [Candidatus Allofournierella merdipullorum]|uniref:hypothetical protein n=1 Tax=Candidatus Allofournierella merdipullorum TaxID=2838595 RepID=UPI00374ECB12
MNTLMSYLYRDASNYKVTNTVVLAGIITQEQIDEIAEALNAGCYFIPSQIGLPEKRFDDYTEDDHCWFELDPETAFSETVQAPTINMTVAELVRKFGEVNGCWDDVWANVYEGL